MSQWEPLDATAKQPGAEHIVSNSGLIVTCSGNAPGGSDNLAPASYDAYVDYLTDVVLYYRDEMNITFSTVEPFNEPSSSWQLGNNQEGCHYDVSTQRTILQVSRLLQLCRTQPLLFHPPPPSPSAHRTAGRQQPSVALWGAPASFVISLPQPSSSPRAAS